MSKCELCGEEMPPGEEMFKYHGYSCECPKPSEHFQQTNREYICAMLTESDSTNGVGRERLESILVDLESLERIKTSALSVLTLIHELGLTRDCS